MQGKTLEITVFFKLMSLYWYSDPVVIYYHFFFCFVLLCSGTSATLKCSPNPYSLSITSGSNQIPITADTSVFSNIRVLGIEPQLKEKQTLVS